MIRHADFAASLSLVVRQRICMAVALVASLSFNVNAQSAAALELPELPGEVTGVLTTVDAKILASSGRSAPPQSLAISIADGDLRWVYVSCDRKKSSANLSFKTLNPDNPYRAEVCLANQAMLGELGLTSLPCLVRFRINDGRGAAEGSEGFAVQNLKQIDGSRHFPAQVSEYLAKTKGLHEAALKQRRAEFDRMIAGRMGAEPKQESTINTSVQTQWNLKQKTVEYYFSTEYSNGSYRWLYGTKPNQKRRVGTTYGLRWDVVYSIDGNRELSEKAEKPVPFARKVSLVQVEKSNVDLPESEIP